MPLVPLKNHRDLRVGLFVKLECSWWKHPFRKNQFKISSAKELETIRAIKKVKILYDPELSDPPPQDAPPPSTPQFEPSLTVDNYGELNILEDLAEDEEEEEDNIPPPAPEPPKEVRRRILHEHRQQFRKVENAYWRILGESKDIFKGISGGNGKGIQQAGEVVSNLSAVLQDNNSTMTLMDVVSSHGMAKGISYHALNVCILSLMTGRMLDLTDEELHALALASLFHDFGQRFLPAKVKFHGSGIMTQIDPETLHLHPACGRDLLKNFRNFPEASLTAVYQHHERLDGSGYPEGLRGDEISKLAQILMVIDEYDDLCNCANPQLSLTPHEALCRLFRKNQHHENAKLSLDVILALIQSISVFPPGTIVELSDGSLGIVTSINMRAPTKPLVLLYVPNSPKHEATLVDLSEEESLTITKSVRPKDLKPEILERLSPRRMAIFIHANPDPAPVQIHLKSRIDPPALSRT